MSYLRNLLLLLLLQSVAFPLLACSQRPGQAPPTDRELFQKAKAVFIAHVYRTEEESRPINGSEKSFAVVDGDFRVIEVLKGTPPANGKVTTFIPSPGNCAVMLMSGGDYIFFTQERYDLVLWPDGSRPFMNPQATESKKFLETFRQMALEKNRP